MALTDLEIEVAAADLLAAEVTQTQIGLLSLRHPQLDMNDAYAIQDELIRQKCAAGRSIIGWKIGLTSKAMQSALGIDIPDSGVLLDDMVFDDKCHIPKGRFIEPRIEAEIAFVLKSPLSGEAVTAEDVVAAVDYVSPAIEILDTRILRSDPETGKARKIVDTISDNAANAGLVMGSQKHQIDAFDLRWVGAIVLRNEEVEETGLGAGVLNNPVMGIVWLVHRLSQFGLKLDAGQPILSGSFIRPLECPPGSRIEADFGAFGSVSVHFD